MRTRPFILFACTLALARLATAEEASVTSDPDNSERLQFTKDDLPKDEKDPAGTSQIDDFAHRHGFNYARLTRRAARGETKALKRFFEIAKEVDGAAAESHAGVPVVVYHLLGDQKFAHFLSAQPLGFRMMVRNSIVSDGYVPSATAYFRRHFPETTKVLFRREMVAWSSPNERYVIRKIFSDAFNLRESKVERAEELNGVIQGHEYTEPVRWGKPNVLVLERHEYYEVLKPMTIGDAKFETIHTLSRWYRITATITPDGKAAAIWKPRKNR